MPLHTPKHCLQTLPGTPTTFSPLPPQRTCSAARSSTRREMSRKFGTKGAPPALMMAMLYWPSICSSGTAVQQYREAEA